MIGMLWEFWCGNTITRDDLGRDLGGGNPHFRPPRYDRANDIYHGIAPGGRYSRANDRRTEDD